MLANVGLFLKFWQPCKISVSLTEKNMKSLVSELSELIASNIHYSVIQSEKISRRNCKRMASILVRCKSNSKFMTPKLMSEVSGVTDEISVKKSL
jgi:hypothetical protein